jgi:hypothetical protein
MLEAEHTVDSNGHALAQDVAIGTLESWDLAKLVEEQVVGTWRGVDFDNIEVKIVCLCNCENGGAADIALLWWQ